VEGLSEHQADQWAYASARPFGLLTGTPGTGKTYTVGAVVKQLAQQIGESSIAICAPTGKAAVRLGESLRRVGVGIQPRTIHSLLEIGRNGHDGDGWGFQRHEDNPLDERVVIVDEASMLDTDLASSLFRACGPGAHVLLVGDPYQLPPVGHGAPLRDLIAAGVPRGHLSEIQRNAGLIVRACAAIKDGKHFDVCDTFIPESGLNLKHIEANEPPQQLAELEKVMRAASRSSRFSGLFETQVIVPTNKSGDLGRKDVNRHLQALLNSEGRTAPPNPFRVMDKIICLKNGWHQQTREAGGTEVYVANGEIGQVVGVEPRATIATFFCPTRNIRIPMGKPREDDSEDGDGAGCDFDLGYAITCHKSQGSEWPCVIILADPSPGARRVCSREWIYTAISRASQLCITIGKLGVLHQMTARVSLEKRKTFLVEELGRVG
jgi:exodeoxyribonuclease V alpha subunit